MVPCPWARQGIDRLAGLDVGVCLTLTAPWAHYRYGPITHAPSLLGGDGGFAESDEDLWDHADVDEVERECQAQIERAMQWGIEVTHLEADARALTHRPEFFDVYLGLALRYGLPMSLPPQVELDRLGFPVQELALDAGALFADQTISLESAALDDVIRDLPAGISEVHLSPAISTPELEALDPHFERRVGDRALLCETRRLDNTIRDAGVSLIGYRTIRERLGSTGSH